MLKPKVIRNAALVCGVLLAVSMLVYSQEKGTNTKGSAVARAVDQAAVDLASHNGNSSPQSVTWIATTQDAAVTAFNNPPGGATPVQGGAAVYALVITGGEFTMYSASRLNAGPPPTGSVFVAILSQTDFSSLGGGVGNVPQSLASLGSPETDSLVGIAPETFAKFHSQYLSRSKK
jgi:hypothetical protein